MIDPTTAIATAGLSAAAKTVGEKSSGIFVEKGIAILSDMNDAFKRRNMKNEKFIEEYFESKVQVLAKIKTILDRSAPTDIRKIYVPTRIKYRTNGGEEICDGNNVFQFIDNITNVAISALGGSGKSTFCKYLFIKTSEYNKYFPIYIEMRKLSQQGISILSGLKSELKPSGLSEKGIIEFLLHQTMSIIILDGWDEIPTDQRSRYFDEAAALMQESTTAKFIFASRPDDRFDSWPNVYKAQILPMVKSDSIALIDKLSVERDVINRFKDQIIAKKYSEYSHLLSNPLLLTIMLLTFSSAGDIPEKKHLFYQQAFDALFYKHDVCKDGLTRITDTKLAEDDFKKITSAFSMISYVKELTAFSKPEALHMAKSAIDYAEVKVSNTAFIEDLKNAVCIIQLDGLQYTFVHKSFQEYFSAYHIFVSRTVKEAVINKLMERARVDQVLDFIYEMCPDYIVDNILKPNLNELIPFMDHIGKTDDWAYKAFDKFIGQIHINTYEGGFVVNIMDPGKSKLHNFCRWLLMKFGEKEIEMETYNQAALKLLGNIKSRSTKPITKLTKNEKQAFQLSKIDKNIEWYFDNLYKIYNMFTSRKIKTDLNISEIL